MKFPFLQVNFQSTAPRLPLHSCQKRRVRAQAVKEGHVALAHRLADTAGKITSAAFRWINWIVDLVKSGFRKPVEIVDKADLSPVTEIDRNVEMSLRELIHTTFPGHSVFGEEYGMEIGHGAGKNYLWVLDPIDGTLSFITGKPLFGTLIALLFDGVPIVGVIDQPVLKDRWIGAVDRATLYNGKPVHTRKCTSIKSAYAYSTTPDMFPDHKARPYTSLKSAVKAHLYGADCYAYGLLSMGLTDIVFEADMKVFDYMAMVPIIKGAGGVITDWSGKELTWDGVQSNGAPSWATETLAVGDPSLHPKLIDLIDFNESS